MERGGVLEDVAPCEMCGRTDCCDSSPDRHTIEHCHEASHEIVRTLAPGQDWSWCYACHVTLRPLPYGSWAEIDPFYEVGLWFAQRHDGETGGLDIEPEATPPEGFRLGLGLTTNRDKGRDGTLWPEQAGEPDALPGWAG